MQSISLETSKFVSHVDWSLFVLKISFKHTFTVLTIHVRRMTLHEVFYAKFSIFVVVLSWESMFTHAHK